MGYWLLVDTISQGWVPGLQRPLGFLAQLAHSHLENLILHTRA